MEKDLSRVRAICIASISLFIISGILADAKRFTHLNYAQLHFKIKTLSQKYPNLLRVYSAQDRFSLPHVGNCSEIVGKQNSKPKPKLCTTYVVELTNFDTLPSDPTRPEWLVSGELHGDEVVGPISVLAFIQYMLSNYNTNSFAQRMIDTRLTVLVPTTNAIGYFKNERYEIQKVSGRSEPLMLDPNRDFAFNQKPEKCMRTVAARVLNELFLKHLFRVAVTFHGGSNAIGYEWGDYSHCKGSKCKPAPDTYIMHALAERMSNNAGPAGPFEEAYPFGDMGKLVYAVNGGMEDWAYGASWDDAALVCRPETLGGYPRRKTKIDASTKRCITYLVETSFFKKPSVRSLGSTEDMEIKGAKGDGHVPRNVRLLFSVIDSLEPYIIFKNSFSRTYSVPSVSWQVSGAFHVDATAVQWSTFNGGSFGMSKVDRGNAGISTAGGVGNTFGSVLPIEDVVSKSEPVYYRIAAIVDRNLSIQPEGSDPDLPPQGHLMGSRASWKWKFSVGDKRIQGRRIYFSETVMVRMVRAKTLVHEIVKDLSWGDNDENQLYSVPTKVLSNIMIQESQTIGTINMVTSKER